MRSGSALISTNICGEREGGLSMDREGGMTQEKLISVPKAAKMLRLSIPYTQRLIRSGKIEGKKIERTWFTSEEAVRRYLAPEDGGGRSRVRGRWFGGEEGL